MEPEQLRAGLELAVKHRLTYQEMRVFIPFLDCNHSATTLAEVLKANKVTLHHTITRLRLKGLIVHQGTDKRNFIYTLNKELP